MTTESSTALVLRFVEEFWSRGNLAAADELMAPDVISHQPEVGRVVDFKAFKTLIRATFLDWHSTPAELIAEWDRVAERWTGRGTYRGEFQGIPPTGKIVAVPGVVFYRIQDGRIAEFRGSFDMLTMLRQLGAMPSGATA